jgi:hypothetical protein
LKERETWPPEKQKSVRDLEKSLALARKRLEAKQAGLAENILQDKVVPGFEKQGEKRGLMRACFLLGKVKESLGKPSEVLAWVERAKTIASSLRDESFAADCEAYLKSLKEKGVLLAKTPFTDPANLGAEKTVALAAANARGAGTRPLPQAFENPYFWRAVDLQRGVDEKGKKRDVAKLPFPGPSEFYLIWTPKGRDVRLARDDGGAGGRPFRYGRNKPEAVRVDLFYRNKAKGRNEARRYEFLAVENLNISMAGSRRTLDPKNSPAFIGLRLRSVTCRKGRIDKKTLLVVDDNTNARFNDGGTREEGTEACDLKFDGCDSLVVGSGPSSYATLYGSLLRVGPTHYLLGEDDVGGGRLTVREYKGPTGKIAVSFRGARGAVPLHLVVGTPTGGKRYGFVNLGGAKGPVSVPVGSYFLKWGLLCAGEDPDQRVDRVEIWKGTYPDFEVKEGRTTEMVLGGPFEVRVPVSVTGEAAELETYKLRVRGAAGETYRRFWNRPFLADYKIVDAGGTTVKAGTLRKFTEQDELTPTALGLETLKFARHVVFKIRPGRVKPPLTAEFKTMHPLLGVVQTKGWK